jgi:drug/metabolite transporter (DMT)-like permease
MIASTLGSPSALALFASFMFGLALVLTQFGLRYIAPLHGALVSIPAATVLLWLLSPILLDWQSLSLNSAVIFGAVGLFFPATVTLLTFEANRQMGPGVSGALANLTPLFTVLSTIIFLHEAPHGFQVLGIAIIIVGGLMLSVDRRWLGSPWPYHAAALPLGVAAIRGVTHPITKLGLAGSSSPFAAALIGYTVSCIVIASFVKANAAVWPSRYGRTGSLWFACVGICNSVGVLTLYAALARGSVLEVSPLTATYPLATLGLTAVLFRPAQISRAVFAGVVTTVAGVILLVAA